MTIQDLRRMRTLSWCAAAAIALAAGAAATAAAERGRPAPDLRLHDGAGAEVTLSDLRGRVVLVDFWASWCAPCRKSFPALAELQSLYGPRGLEVIAVNVDQQRRDADAFLAVQPRGPRVVFDEQGATPRAFQVQGMPSSYVIARDGTIRYVHVGFTEKVAEDCRREILELLGEAGANGSPTR